MPDPSPRNPLPRSRGLRPLAVALISALAAGLTACGPSRSVESYCGVMAEHKDRFVAATEDVGTADPVSGLTSLVATYGDLNSMWAEAATVAPEEIQADVETVRDAWASQQETAEKMAENPLKGLASGLMTGITSAGATQRVDVYTAETCPDVGAMFFAAEGTGSSGADGTQTSTGGSSASEDTSTTVEGSGIEGSTGGIPAPDPSQDWSPFGPVLTTASTEDGALSGPSTVFVPELGEMEVTADLLLEGAEVWNEQYLPFAEGDAPRLAGLITVRVPSSGLVPEGYVTSVVSVDLSSGVARVEQRIDGEQTAEPLDRTLAGTSGDGVAVVQTSGEESSDLVAFDLSTQDVAWQRTGANLRRHGALGFGWMTDPPWSGFDCAGQPYDDEESDQPVSYHWTDLATGTPAFSMPLLVDGQDGGVCRNIGLAVSPRFSMVERYNIDRYETEEMYILDHETQETPPIPGPINRADPVGTAGVLLHGNYRIADDEPADLLVVDLSTGEEMYRMEQERAEALDLEVHALFDGILYLSTTDEQIAVDVTSGDEVGSWSVFPLHRVGDHTLLSDGAFVEDWSYTGE